MREWVAKLAFWAGVTSLLIAVALVLTGCVSAPAEPIDWSRVRPPEPYLSAGQAGLAEGRYIIQEVEPWRIARYCAATASACTIVADRCYIYVRPGADEMYGYGAVLAHEAAHCEGWPGNHPGAGSALVTVP